MDATAYSVERPGICLCYEAMRNAPAVLALCALFWCCTAPDPAPPASQGTVWHCARVIDGDTIAATRSDWPGADIRIRVWGVDAPEHNLPGGKEATQATQEFIEGKNFTVISHGKEKYGRDLDEIFVNGESLGVMLLARHLAIEYHGGKRVPAETSAAVSAWIKQGGL